MQDLCILVHGMQGSECDWLTWQDVLADQFPAMHVKALRTLSRGTRFFGHALDVLASDAADEIVETVKNIVAHISEGEKLKVHMIGHSMGGLIIRGALPKVLDAVGHRIQLGHYVSLSTPHMGIQAPLLCSPLHGWRNLSKAATFISQQLAQLSIEDSEAYLMQLSDPNSPYMAALGRFEDRTCITLSAQDPLISVCSGVLDPSAGKAQDSGSLKARRVHASLKSLAPRTGKKGVDSDVDDDASTACSDPTETTGSGADSDTNSEYNNTSSSPLTWLDTENGTCRYPRQLHEGLCSVTWQRQVITIPEDVWAFNAHVFLIGKASEQWTQEHAASRQCIETIAATALRSCGRGVEMLEEGDIFSC
mmetsp:Transcript_30045/g.70018  ORF Transcript_30045/g.70018 Transcript_30045/m.70018 type:complete len:364 (+) Transcript_30045:116-1207(+)